MNPFKRSTTSPFETRISNILDGVPKTSFISLDALLKELSPVLTQEVIPRLRNGWKAAGSPIGEEHGLKLPFSDVFSRIVSGTPNDWDVRALLIMACMNATHNSMMSVDDEVVFKSGPIRTELPGILEKLMSGSLSDTKHMHYTTSSYTGERTTFALSGFSQVIGKTPELERPNRTAMDVKGTVNDLRGEILVVTSLEGPVGGDVARAAYEVQVGGVGDINYGIVRERANIRSLVRLGIARFYVPQDETISIVQEEGGVKVFSGRVDAAQTLITEGEVMIGSSASFQRIFDVQDMTHISRYIDDLVAAETAVRVKVPPTTEKTRARFLIDDNGLMRGDDEPVLIAAIGDFPMPAMGSLPADPVEPEPETLGF